MAKTYKERLAAGLKASGWKQAEGVSCAKYQVWTHVDRGFKLYLGPNGALRSGYTVAESRSIGCPSGHQNVFYLHLLGTGDAELAKALAGETKESLDARIAALQAELAALPVGDKCAVGQS